ncbi:MAG: VC0807 family protein [Solirubrobacteraceae bacterium]
MAGIVESDRRRTGDAAPGASRRSTQRLLIGVLVPVTGYLLARRWLHSDAMALAVAEVLPIAWMLGVGVRHHRVEPVAAVAALVLAIALAIALLSGGSALALKLRRAVVSGSLGLACLGSVAVRRPILPAMVTPLVRAWPQLHHLGPRIDGLISRDKTTVITVIFGVTCLCDAGAQVALALTVSTTTFVSVTGLTRLTVLALGVAVCVGYLRLQSGRHARNAGPPAKTDRGRDHARRGRAM